jgi:hypothetical protein
MPNYEARIPTRFGELVVHFDTANDFAEGLKALDVEAMTEAVNEHLGSVVIREPRPIKPSLIGICGFSADGTLEIYRLPSEKLELIGIVLMAYDPDPVDVTTIRKVSGIPDAGSYLSKQKYATYFEKVGRGSYRLSHKGKLWVTNDILPALKEQEDGKGKD